MSNLQKIVVLCVVGGIVLVGGFLLFNDFTQKDNPPFEVKDTSEVEEKEMAEEPPEQSKTSNSILVFLT